MRYPIRGALTLLLACMLLGAGQAPAGGSQPSTPYTDHELTDAEKAALAKQRMERCRLHPGTCMQGAEHAKDGKIIKPEPAAPSGPPPESAEK